MAPASQISAPIPFGNYLLDELLAVGGMARVYRARLRGLGGFEKTLVVKQILPELATDPRFVSMFVEEAKTVVRMSHPHIVPVYELGVIAGTYFLSMEYVEGASLAQILHEGPLAPELTAHVGAQLADALHFAHTRFDMVHRDVTPRNVLVDSSGHVRLVDFGISAPSSDQRPPEGQPEVFGSPGYMSPEQLRSEAIGFPSDLFSLGAVLFEMLTGEPAFLREGKEATRAAILVDPLPRLETRSELPRDLSRIIARCIERDPSARPASAAEFGRSLRGWLAAHHPEGVAEGLGERAVQAQRRVAAGAPPSELSGAGGDAATAKVETLATSPVLTALLEGSEVAPAPSAREASSALSSTQPIAERVEAVAMAMAAAPGSAPRSSSRRWGMALLGASVLVAGLMFALGGEPPEPRVESGVHPTPAPVPVPVPAPGPTPVLAPSLSPAPAPSTAAEVEVEPARLSINAMPWAEVRVDGRLVGNTPLRRVEVEPGAHRLTLHCPPLGRSETLEIELRAGQRARVVADMSVDPPAVSVR